MLTGLRVLELGDDESVAYAGRLFADLGADVVRPVRSEAAVAAAVATPEETSSYATVHDWIWASGKSVLACDDAALADLLGGADVVVTSRDDATRHPRSGEPGAVWVTVSPYGGWGPRAGWRGSDLTTIAGSGNMFASGDPDRAPLRCWLPIAHAHAGAEAVMGALTALHWGGSREVDVSVQEAVEFVNLFETAPWPSLGHRGTRMGSRVGKTPDVWTCRDGFVAMGLRGGPARANSMRAITALVAADGIDAGVLEDCAWESFNYLAADFDLLETMSVPLREYFARHTRAELYQQALEHKIMLAPLNSAGELLQSAQLEARGLFLTGPNGWCLPGTFLTDGLLDAKPPIRSFGPVRAAAPPDWVSQPSAYQPAATKPSEDELPWAGLKILELGSGLAGPSIARYFVQGGATCIRIESRSRVDMMRLFSGHQQVDPTAPQYEGSRLFAHINAGKQSLSLDLRDERARGIIRRLVRWCDVVTENFSPGTMAKWGFGYEDLSELRPGLVMLSSCLWGATGPECRYPGFGSQGAAISGHTGLTGWPDRAPTGIYPGAVTDSLGPAYAAAALAAALLRRDRTGEGAYLDLSQVETAVFTASAWLAYRSITGNEVERMGNRHGGDAIPHGAFPCRGDDRWVAIAIWDDADWERLAALTEIDDGAYRTIAGRRAAEDEIERRVGAWTAERDASEVATQLQEHGIDAYPVNDFGEVHGDPQLRARGHFVEVTQPFLGTIHVARAGFRIDGAGVFVDSAPQMGGNTRAILQDVLGMSVDEVAELEQEQVLR
jgi:crotonobetainyl-CoA:carnitine CoA-transferase CaiB-like acyl-CoA transferase